VGGSGHVVALVVADPLAAAAAVRAEGVLVEVPIGGGPLLLAVTALHTRAELLRAARVLGRAAPARALRPAA
jgi:hypothetical protein